MTARSVSTPVGLALRVALSCSLAVLILTGSACAPSPHIPAHVQSRPKPDLDLRSLERTVHDLVNRERAKHGLTRLAWDDALARIARGHSRDMGKRSYFSHDSPEGRDFSFRYQEQGYSCAIRTGTTTHLGAENIASSYLYRSVTTVNGVAYPDWNTAGQIAETTVRGWMDSPGHRKNILTPHWQNEGIGIFVAPDDRVYITQNFC